MLSAAWNKEKPFILTCRFNTNTYNDICKNNIIEMNYIQKNLLLNEDNDNINDIIFRVGRSRYE